MEPERIIGEYSGKERGPLLICLGGVHGNELAGVEALEKVFQLLELEPSLNPNFQFKGTLIGLRGNLPALAKGIRFIDCDLNRLWTKENVTRIFAAQEEELKVEELELKKLYTVIHQKIEEYQPDRLVLMDLHTTTASGGIFSIATDDLESQRIALELHAPVITGFLKNINGTTLHYFTPENIQMDTTAVCFESGQHEELDSISNAVSAIINCMRSIDCLNAHDVENKHDELLTRMSKHLPKLAELLYCHPVEEEDGFLMNPGYLNFQSIEKGELLARDKSAIVTLSPTKNFLSFKCFSTIAKNLLQSSCNLPKSTSFPYLQ